MCSKFHLHWPLTNYLRLERDSILGTPLAAHGPTPQMPRSSILPLTYLPIPKPGHTTGGSRRDGAWLGRERRRRLGSPRVSVPRSHQRTQDNCPERLFGSTNNLIRYYLSSPKPGQTTGGSGRGARRGRAELAGSSRIECLQNCSPRQQGSFVPAKA